MQASRIRRDPVGADRFGREYFWDRKKLVAEIIEEASFLENLGFGRISFYHSLEELSKLSDCMDPKIPSEKNLQDWIQANRDLFRGISKESVLTEWQKDSSSNMNGTTSSKSFCDLMVDQVLEVKKSILSIPQHRSLLKCAKNLDGLLGCDKTDKQKYEEKCVSIVKKFLLDVDEILLDRGAFSTNWRDKRRAGFRETVAAAVTSPVLSLQARSYGCSFDWWLSDCATDALLPGLWTRPHSDILHKVSAKCHPPRNDFASGK
eukprot:757758-Hanusia_phi.AAC.3